MHYIQIHRDTPAWEALCNAMNNDTTVYVRIAVDGLVPGVLPAEHCHAVKVKANERVWSPPLYAGITTCDCAACNTRDPERASR